MRFKCLLICFFLITMCNDSHAQTKGVSDQQTRVRKRMEIDTRPESPWIEGCLAPAFRAAGWNWSQNTIQGLRGLGFVFSMRVDGGHVWHREDYMYGDYTLEVLAQFDEHFELFHVSPDNPYSAPSQELIQARKKAWDAVRSSLDKGLPAIVWKPVTQEMSDEHPNPMLMKEPSFWSLIVGYDEIAETYVIDSSSSKGRFTIGWDAFGNNDRSRKFLIMIIKPKTESFDALKTHRALIQRAVDISQGLYPGNTSQATAHGLAAWQMWLDAFHNEKASTDYIEHHASFLKLARGWAITYLRAVRQYFPEDARLSLREAIQHYKSVSDAMRELIRLQPYATADFKEGAKIISRAIEHERAAIANLQQALAK